MLIKVILNIFFFSYVITKSLISVSDELKFMSEMFQEEPIALKANLKVELFDVRCFWAKGWNVYDISDLETTNYDWNITNASGIVFFNFCSNTYKTCPNTSPTVMLGIDALGNCTRLAGNDTAMNGFSLQNSSDPNSGLQISLSNGQVCQGDQFYSTEFVIDCDANMTQGQLELYNAEDFNINNCVNVLKGKSAEVCPTVNYYMLSYFIETYGNFLGIIIICLGFFLLMFGAKFLKVTVVIVGTLAMLSLSFLVMFNFFQVSSNNVVWIVIAVSFVLGLAFSYFLSKLLTLFVMIVGGYMGYTFGIFLYNLVLNFIHASPVVVYWVTLVICVAIGAAMALKAAKHVMIIGTSLVGGYGVIRGASLYIGNFPNETMVIDLIKHGEWSQLEGLLNNYIYFYLAVWFILTIAGLIAQYKINVDKNSDDYKKIDSKN